MAVTHARLSQAVSECVASHIEMRIRDGEPFEFSTMKASEFNWFADKLDQQAGV